MWVQHSGSGAGAGLLKSFEDFPWECTIPRPQLQLQDGWHTAIVRLARKLERSYDVAGTHAIAWLGHRYNATGPQP